MANLIMTNLKFNNIFSACKHFKTTIFPIDRYDKTDTTQYMIIKLNYNSQNGGQVAVS